MKATTQAEGRNYYLNWELQKAAEKMLREIMKVQPGETVLITCDTSNDERVIHATAGAALTMGAYPIVMQYPASLDQAIMIEPTKPVLEAIKAADSADSDAIAQALSGVTYTGVTGDVVFDDEGDVDKNIIFIKGVDTEKGEFYSVKEQGLAQ